MAAQAVHHIHGIEKRPSSLSSEVDCEPEPRRALGQDVRHEYSHRLLKLVGFLSFALLLQQFLKANFGHRRFYAWQSEALSQLCPQVEAITSPNHEALLRSLDEEFGSSAFKLKVYESLGGAVRIPTESYDDHGLPSEDPRWKSMAKFHDYLESRFPNVHRNLKRIKVNTYALVYEWKGTANVKPLLLAAHQDVIPVHPDTYDNWVYPPYSGYFDGEWIWGRGSCDAKSNLIGILTGVELLLERDFVPSRTVLFAFGIDEESGGKYGARAINDYLLEIYGRDSLAMIIDEGKRFEELGGVIFASPGVAEKGTMNIRMEVLTPGGHSSTPPNHTGIGILANLITEFEAHPHNPELIRGRTYYQGLECRAKYYAGFPESLTKLLLESQTSDKKLRELGDRLVDFDPLYYAIVGTTQAIDLVGGGVKVNALPEIAWAVADYRIADHDSLAGLMNRSTDIALRVSAKYNMTLEAFGEKMGSQVPSAGTIRLCDTYNKSVAPAPVTPTTGSGPYELVSGTIRSTIQTHLRTDDLPKSAIVSPGSLTANTDTKYYWNLTRHIFRYNHWGARDSYNGAHTINEGPIRAEAFLEEIRFFTRLILNADQSDLLE